MTRNTRILSFSMVMAMACLFFLFSRPHMVPSMHTAVAAPPATVTTTAAEYLPLIANEDAPTVTQTATVTHPATGTPADTPTAIATPTLTPTPTPSVAYRLYGLNFGPYVDGQDPNQGAQVSERQLRERMAIIAPSTQWIRTFGMDNGLEKAGRIAHELGLKAALGARLSADRTGNAQQIANLIQAAQAGEAEMVIVGSEVLRRKELTPTALIDYINQVQAAVPPTVTVTTADTFDQFIANPALISAVDVVMANYYPYWTGLPTAQGVTTTQGITITQTIPFAQAIAAVDDWYQQTQAVAGGKPVIVSETGWPSCGETIYQAVPSPQNASFSFLNFVSWARAKDVSYFYFEALDESWKANEEGPQGACWGVWDKDGNLKPGMQRVFADEVLPDNWSGEPTIGILHAPPYGTRDDSQDDLIGHVWHVNPADYKVAVYLYVNGGWWTKPSENSRLCPIEINGNWRCDVNTGGVDYNATKFIAYLVPTGYLPPLVLGAPMLPIELNQYRKVEVSRVP